MGLDNRQTAPFTLEKRTFLANETGLWKYWIALAVPSFTLVSEANAA